MKLENDIIIPSKLEIDPYVYLDIILKYKSYLKLIYLFGGYMFIEHIYKFSNKAKRQTFKDIHSMQKSKLLKIINVNTNSYVLLTKTSVKYLKNKPNIAYLQPPTSTQIKTCCYLAEYISNPYIFFNPKNPYKWFIDKYKNEINNYKNKSENVDMDFLIKNKERVKRVKQEEIRSIEYKDVFSNLRSSRIFYDCMSNDLVNILILDFDRTRFWINKVLIEKIEPIFKILSIYKGYNLKILTQNSNREERLRKDLKRSFNDLIFLESIEVINLNIDKYFQSTLQKESFLKDIDKFEIAKLQEKLKSNSNDTK